MSKLHFYRKIGSNISKFANGDGELSEDGFSVKITKGKVERGHTYEVRIGTGLSGYNYPCTTGAEKDGTAQFGNRQAI